MGEESILIIDSTYDDYLPECEVLETAGFTVHTCREDDSAGIARHAPSCLGLLVNLMPVAGALLDSMPRCRIVARYGVGYDSVDVEAATARGIWVSNVQDYATEDVSDHTLALLFGAVRRIPFRDREVRTGGWYLFRRQQSHRTAGRVLGIVGYGSIGSTVHRKLSGISFSRVLVADPYIDPSRVRAAGAEPVDHETLYRESDFVTLHLPLNDETRHIIDSEALGLMKPDSILINTSRGGVIDTQALIAAIQAGSIGYAALDVHEPEPLPPDSPLFALDRVILTDHCAWYTEESLAELKRKSAENVRDAIRSGKPRYPVNLPPEPRS